MDLQGNLNETNLQEILQEFSLSRTTGKLILEKNGDSGFIFFSNGLIASACSPNTFKALENTLLKKGFITQETWQQIIAESQKLKDEVIIKLLEAKGFIPANISSQLLEKHTQISIFDFPSLTHIVLI